MVKGVYRYIDKSLDNLISKELKRLTKSKRIKKKVTYINASKKICVRFKK